MRPRRQSGPVRLTGGDGTAGNPLEEVAAPSSGYCPGEMTTRAYPVPARKEPGRRFG